MPSHRPPPVGRSPKDPLGLCGQLVGDKYRIDQAAGEGGFAVVYKATHVIWEKPVALKLFTGLSNASELARPQLVQDFINEGSLLAELSSHSSAIVQARDVGTFTLPDGQWIPYIVLEWLEGLSLDQILDEDVNQSRPPWTIAEMLRVVMPVAEALEVAHRRGVAHRDVKPGNIFVLGGDPRTHAVTIKILDFGVAKLMSDSSEVSAALAKTGKGISSFTPNYGAPEQFSKSFGATGPWTDVFALALVAIELISGRSALSGDDLAQLAFSATAGTRPTPRNLGVDVPDAVDAVFARALAVDTQTRLKTAGAFLEALVEALEQSQMAPALGMSRTGSLRANTPIGFDKTTLASAAPATHPPAPIITGSGSGLVSTAHPRLTPLEERLHGNGKRPRSWKRTGPPILLGLGAMVTLGLGFLTLRGGQGFSGSAQSNPWATVSARNASALVLPAPSHASLAPTPAPCPKDMALIPAGQLFLGSDRDDALDNEKPVHHVELRTFCIDLTEVTTDSYKTCSDEGACLPAGKAVRWKGSDQLPKHDIALYSEECNANHFEDRGNHPINCVSWEMARRFCESQGKRLPTEAEWEYAARGPDGRSYPWGDSPATAKHLNACGAECVKWHRDHLVATEAPVDPLYSDSDGFATTAPVGSFPLGDSRFGPHDVAGNVWEWVADWFGPYGAEDVKNPLGPESGKERVVRGGAFNGPHATCLRPSFRFKQDPEVRSWGIGFRCARNVNEHLPTPKPPVQ